jgi:hypothetical protein
VILSVRVPDNPCRGEGVEERKATCNPDPINIIGDHTFPFHDIIELGTPAVEDDGIQGHTVKELRFSASSSSCARMSPPTLMTANLAGCEGCEEAA